MKSLFTIHAGEWLVGEKLEKRYADQISVWVPGSKDRGNDLLITNKAHDKFCTLQVKFSKSHLPGQRDPLQKIRRSGGWWQFDEEQIRASPSDFWIMVLYDPHERNSDVVLIKPKELAKRYKRLQHNRTRIQSYLTVLEYPNHDPVCVEVRSMKRDEKTKIASDPKKISADRNFTQFLNEWGPLEDILGITALR